MNSVLMMARCEGKSGVPAYISLSGQCISFVCNAITVPLVMVGTMVTTLWDG